MVTFFLIYRLPLFTNLPADNLGYVRLDVPLFINLPANNLGYVHLDVPVFFTNPPAGNVGLDVPTTGNLGYVS